MNSPCENSPRIIDNDEVDISEMAYCRDWSTIEKYFNDNKETFHVDKDIKKRWQACDLQAR